MLSPRQVVSQPPLTRRSLLGKRPLAFPAYRATRLKPFSVPIKSERRLYSFVLTRFLHANRYPLRSKTLYIFKSAGNLPPFSASLIRTCLCSQIFMVAESLVSPE